MVKISPDDDAATANLAPSATDAGRVLIEAMRSLSSARSLEEVARIVRSAARTLVAADGATFVLLEGAQSFYLDEDAITPLWKGRRFDAQSCVSGLAMREAKQVTIADIRNDARVPQDLYAETFVRSMVMTPVRKTQPIAAIGTYWASARVPHAAELRLLQDLADATALTIENVQLVEDLERRVKARTAELTMVNAELESFANVVAHDLRSPLAVVLGFGSLIRERDVLPQGDAARDHLSEILNAGERMEAILGALLSYSRFAKVPLHVHPLNLSDLVEDVATRLLGGPYRGRNIELSVEPNLLAHADPILIDALLKNLLDNACKFTSERERAVIRIGATRDRTTPTFYISDNGCGFEAKHKERLFLPFQRFVSAAAAGAGVGLATCARIVRRHDGRIWAESTVGEGATFFFSLAGPQGER